MSRVRGEGGRLRIIGGRHRGRRIEAPADVARPTSDRVREALFNILMHPGEDDPDLEDARVLDACAGSGAFGLECLSRGAAHATFFDTSRRASETVKRNAGLLGERNVDIRLADATRPPRAAPGRACTIAFLDPPYDSDVPDKALPALVKSGWLAPGALVVIERSERADPPEAEDFTLEDRRDYGSTVLYFVRFAPGGQDSSAAAEQPFDVGEA